MQHHIYIKKTKSTKRLSRAKTDNIGNKYSNSNDNVKKIMLVAEIKSRVYKPKIYKEVIIDPIHSK